MTKATAGGPNDEYNGRKPRSRKQLDSSELVKSIASRNRDFSNLTPGVSGRPGLTYDDYYYHRPEERVPTKFRDIFYSADMIYNRVGLIWNVINLMSDFTYKGIRLVHPQRRKEKIFQDWWHRIGGLHVSERIVNYLYRTGNFVVQRYTAKIKQEDDIAIAADQIGLPRQYKLAKNEIPWKYVFIHPGSCEIIGGALSSFANQPTYGIKLSEDIKRAILHPKEEEKSLIDQIPEDIRRAAESSSNLYVLDPARTIVRHFKKDDWLPWAYPVIYPIMDDIQMLHKLKLADMCALDGGASKIRIIKLGDVEKKLYPTPEASDLLSGILEANVGGGVTDVIWTEDIDIIETTNDSYNFLGEEKYKPTLNNIYTGLGIPPTLTANFGSGGTTNNYISLKTLTERLEYGRMILVEFWKQEIALFQKAMNYKVPAEIEFDQPILANEDTEKQLLIQLADRNLISDEILQKRFGMNPNLEKIRLNREARERRSGRRVQKAGQWFDPQVEEKMKLTLLQTGTVTPSQVGLELEEADPKEIKQMIKLTQKGGSEQKKNPGQSGKGRPPGKKDTTTRKTKKFSPRGRASILAWASTTQKQVAESLTPVFLEQFGKKNLRQLTTEEDALFERVKFTVLCGITPYDEFSPAKLPEILRANLTYPTHIELLREKTRAFTSDLGREPNVDEMKVLQVEVYSELALIGDNEC